MVIDSGLAKRLNPVRWAAIGTYSWNIQRFAV
jgi:hypothetical protein